MDKFVIRNGKREDCKEIMRLIKELADFEKKTEYVRINTETLEKDGFDTDNPAFYCIVAEHPENASELIGYVLYYIGYATWNGKRAYLNDIMVTEKFRKSGVGSLLFKQLCQEALKLDCKVINFRVLDWNPAIKFYKKIGAEDYTVKSGWHCFCLDESKIKEIVQINQKN
ncbi:hypothetical protein O3M35_009005 [Rhynocoris fuscipes]|uniref:N-acetyltransferase domain-containing protein n=1 Tax=Rhynocoris fuscipes TaxID=488301 RepID=A0AAW1D904_9HEMI